MVEAGFLRSGQEAAGDGTHNCDLQPRTKMSL